MQGSKQKQSESRKAPPQRLPHVTGKAPHRPRGQRRGSASQHGARGSGGPVPGALPQARSPSHRTPPPGVPRLLPPCWRSPCRRCAPPRPSPPPLHRGPLLQRRTPRSPAGSPRGPLGARAAHGADVSRPTSRAARRSPGRAGRGLARSRGKCPPSRAAGQWGGGGGPAAGAGSGRATRGRRVAGSRAATAEPPDGPSDLPARHGRE